MTGALNATRAQPGCTCAGGLSERDEARGDCRDRGIGALGPDERGRGARRAPGAPPGAQRRAQRGRHPRRGAGPGGRGRAAAGPARRRAVHGQGGDRRRGAAGLRGLAAATAEIGPQDATTVARLRRRARSWSARRTSPSSARTPTRRTSSTARRATRSTPRARREARAEARAPRWRPACRPSASAPTTAGRSGRRRASAAWPGCGRARLCADRRAPAASQAVLPRAPVDDRAARADGRGSRDRALGAGRRERVGFAPLPARVGIFRDALDRYVSAECAAAVELPPQRSRARSSTRPPRSSSPPSSSSTR